MMNEKSSNFQQMNSQGEEKLAADQLREVFAEVWSRRIPVPGRWPEEYVIPIDAKLSREIRRAFVGVMRFD